jgi:hypothetical protein
VRILGIIFAVLAILMGLRITFIGVITAFSGKVMVRRGIKSGWEPAVNRDEVWRFALRNVVMGILLVILGVALIV